MLPDLIKYAEYNNWGDPKATDGPNIIGYLNFKCKCIIDGKKECIRLAVQFQKGGNYNFFVKLQEDRLFFFFCRVAAALSFIVLSP